MAHNGQNYPDVCCFTTLCQVLTTFRRSVSSQRDWPAFQRPDLVADHPLLLFPVLWLVPGWFPTDVDGIIDQYEPTKNWLGEHPKKDCHAPSEASECFQKSEGCKSSVNFFQPPGRWIWTLQCPDLKDDREQKR